MKNILKSRRFFLGLFPVALLLFPSGCASPDSATAGLPACCQKHARQVVSPEPGGSVADLDAIWETDSGQNVRLSDLNGRIRVISMFYATCQGVCVITKEDMQAIEASLSPAARKKIGFILVTLDARRDTAEALRNYRHTEGLSNERWTLLRGDDAATRKLASLLGVDSGRDASGRFVHSSELVVLDESGQIIHHHSGVRANLQAITIEIEAAAGSLPTAQNRIAGGN